MKKYSWVLALSLAWGISAQAATVRVNVINGTTGIIPNIQEVTLVAPMLGMQPLATAKPINGTATFENIDMNAAPALLAEGTYQGVKYSAVVRENTLPGAEPGSYATDLEVYEIAAKPDDSLHVEMTYFVVTAFGDSLYIEKEFRYINNTMPPLTFKNPEGLIRFFIPQAGQSSTAVDFKHGTMPLKTFPSMNGEQASLPNELKPGETKIHVTYRVPFMGGSGALKETFYNDFDHFHLYSRPPSLQVVASGLSNEGADEAQNLTIYAANNVKAGQTLNMRITGSSSANMQPVLQPIVGSTQTVITVVLALLVLAIGLSYSFTHESNSDPDLTAQLTALQETRQTLLKQLNTRQSDTDIVEKQKLEKRLRKIYQRLQEHNAL